MEHRTRPHLRLLLLLAIPLLLTDCSCDDDKTPAAATNNGTANNGVDDVGNNGTNNHDASNNGMDADEPPLGAEIEAPLDCTLSDFPARTWQATIRWTSYGIPHIVANDVGGLAYGQAYAMAQHHICTIADQVIYARGERSLYFGPGEANANVDSDFLFKILRLREGAACQLNRASATTREALEGFVAGYNAYLAEVGQAGLPAPCNGAEWVKPLTVEDLWAYYQRLNLRASGINLAGYILSSKPPGSSNKPSTAAPTGWPRQDFGSLGSNGVAIGAERAASGRGMLVSNTHFPWEGELRWFESQLTIPGQWNSYGVGLVGTFGTLVGFNEHVAWSHTVSASSRFNFYTLAINPDAPETYFYDGQVRRMKKRTYEVAVKLANGDMGTETRTYYRSHYGPIINIPPYGWSTTLASTYRDANEDNVGVLDHWIQMANAGSLDELLNVHRDVNGIPWVNTIATDTEGNALYIDSSNVPNLTDEAIAAWRDKLESDVLTQLAYQNGVILLDGGDPLYEWAEARGRNVAPFEAMPRLQRRDYVLNANDPYWLTNPDEPLTGYSPFFGKVPARPSQRTRMNHRYAREVRDGGASGADGLFTRDELEAMFFSDRAFIADELREGVVARCTGAGMVEFEGAMWDVGAACDVLAAWDGAYRIESVGAALWREFFGTFLTGSANAETFLWANLWDEADPLGTPNTLAEPAQDAPDFVHIGLAQAIKRLTGAGFSIDQPLGELQYTLKGDQRLPIHGGYGYEGAFNVISFSNATGSNSTLLPKHPTGPTVSPTGLTADGYPVNNGSSFVMVLGFEDDGPHARAVTTYSQSSDPASPHFADQTALYGQQTMRPVLFTEEEIAQDPELSETTVRSE